MDSKRQYQMFIDGEFVDSGSKKTMPVINPATEEVYAEVPEGTVEDVQRAIDAAERAQKQWAKLPAIERAGYLRAIAAEIRKDSDILARSVTEEMGKILPLAKGCVEGTAGHFEYIAEWARRLEGEIIPSDSPNENMLLYKAPIGVVAGILPWNFSFWLIGRKAGPALLTGNTIVLKPSSESPIDALLFAKICERVNLPKGVLNVVTGRGSVVGHTLSASPKVGIISLTGSCEAGTEVMRAAADNITKVSLELGGKAPAIVMDDADLDLAAKCIVISRINNSGQVCNCAERAYVHEKVADAFIEKVVAEMSKVRYGRNPLEDLDLDMGPLVSRTALENVDAMVKRAVAAGAKVALGGKVKEVQGYHYEPTVLVNCNNSMEIMHKEIFGPVLPIATFKDLDEAIELANDCEYGLTSSIYTQNLDVAMRACNEIKFGETYVNRENGEAFQGFHAGWRKSGIGGADGKHGIEEYLMTHLVYIRYNTNKK